MAVFNIARSVRVANGTTLSGSEAPDIEIPTSPDQAISASAEEEVTIAFNVADLQVLSLLCDQDVKVQVLETRFAILQTANAAPTTITHTGDLEQEIFSGDLVRVEDTVGDDGIYQVDTVVLAAGDTTLTLVNGQTVPVAGGGAVGTVARVASKQAIGYSYAVTSTTAGTGAIVIAGNVSDKFVADDLLILADTVGNDGIWEIRSVTVVAGVTTIVVNVAPGGAAGLPATEGVVGFIYSARAGFKLTANSPFLWSIASGVQNPFIHPSDPSITPAAVAPAIHIDGSRGNVVAFMVDNTDNAIAAQFDARVGHNSNIYI